MPLYLKFCITIFAIIFTCGLYRAIEDRRKRIIITMLILLAISTFSNRSIYWFIYWDGPYFGKVIDADTGEPIEGACVAGIWEIENFMLIASMYHFANATETVTDADGEFTIPLTFAFTLWPMSGLDEMDLVVFKPGYDSHPPAIQRKMEKPEHIEHTSPDGNYFVGRRAHCKIWRKCEVRLNKAMSYEERRQASGKCLNILASWGMKTSKIKKFVKALKDDNPSLKNWWKK
ncbi:hypothetical protein DSCA_60900 [Desulfosarcina alkanivorans]|jgi:hypothetical protein|uniref:Carboxypeptidase regulatory-like domain-containing protein n=1 Tax=Desulfosarcina alkanivorans TaxID=571177 RepID=A0A5K7YV17_9BACT|nr:hypothetical protein [Desulfosarcina alkanivorans]BBO72160.1 hypothetical protein DSCA_60900 [Desulfosarcina alkanivorans]